MDNFAEYAYPALYDLENADFEPDGSFYLAFAKQLGGAVLELGCGTGRMTIPLARQGIQITGLDAAPQMLALAREKAGDLPIEWVEADARDFHLGRQFRLIFECGAVFMHMLTNADQLAFLARVREHLAPGGLFVLSLFFPHKDFLDDVTEEKEWFSYPDAQGRTVRVSGTEHYDELRQVKTETAYRHIISASGEEEQVIVAPLELRYTFPLEAETLLARAGFRIIERFGGPDRSPLENSSRFMVYACALEK